MGPIAQLVRARSLYLRCPWFESRSAHLGIGGRGFWYIIVPEMQKKIDAELMEMGEEMFWDEFETLEGAPNERYSVVRVDATGKRSEIVVTGARLVKKKRKARV